MKILFVENHAVFAANVVREFLSRHAVTVVPSIAAARQARVAASFDVVLVDYDLDDGKGDEFVRELCASVRRMMRATPRCDERAHPRFAARCNLIGLRV
jgi:DNA-binding response OmpR family regulator